jgi:hypothetical protein
MVAALIPLQDSRGVSLTHPAIAPIFLLIRNKCLALGKSYLYID